MSQPQAPDPGDAFAAACAFRGVINYIGVLWGPSSKATVAPSGAGRGVAPPSPVDSV